MHGELKLRVCSHEAQTSERGKFGSKYLAIKKQMTKYLRLVQAICCYEVRALSLHSLLGI